MNITLKQFTTYITISTLIIGGIVLAGSLFPSSNTDTQNFVTLEEIYQRTQHFDSAISPHNISYSSSATGTMHTLEDIKNSMMSVMVPDVSDVRVGVHYGNARNDLVGTMTANCTPGTNATGTIYTSATTTNKLVPEAAPTSTMITIEDVYQRMYNFDYSTTSPFSAHSLSTSSQPASSMHTLQDIWNAMLDITLPNEGDIRQGIIYGQASFPRIGTLLEGCPATTPTSINLAVGSVNPVGGVTDVVIPAAGGTDTTGAATGWVTGTEDKIKFTVVDGGSASSTITIDSNPYTSGADYTITSTSSLTIVVTTNETGKMSQVRTFVVGVTAGLSLSTPNVWVLNNGTDFTLTKLDTSGNIIGTYGTLAFTQGVAVDIFGDIWVARPGMSTVSKFNSSGALIGTYSVGSSPTYVAIDASGNVWVTNQGSNNVTKLNSSGSVLGTYSTGNAPYAVAVDGSNNIWIANGQGQSVTKLNSSGATIGTYSTGGTSGPFGLAIDASGNVWVTNNNDNTVSKFNSSGTPVGTYSVGSLPTEVAIDASGNVWVTNRGSNNVSKLNSSGALIGTYPVGTAPRGIAVDASGNVWVANYGNYGANDGSVTKLNSSGSVVGTYVVGGNPTSNGDMTGFALQYFVLGLR